MPDLHLMSPARRGLRPLLASVLLLTSGGCVDSDGASLFVSGHGVFDDECLIDPANSTFLLSGQMDVSGNTSYAAQPIFRNSLFNLASTAGRSNPSWIAVASAVVTLTEPGGAVINFGGLPNPFSVDMSVVVPSGDGANAGTNVGQAILIPANYASALAPSIAPNTTRTVIAKTQFLGKTLGEIDIESTEWIWPIALCNGCNQVCGLAAQASCQRCLNGEGCPVVAIPPCECLTDGDCGAGTCNRGLCE